MSLCSPLTRDLADAILASAATRTQIGPITAAEPSFTPEDGQRVSHEITRRRIAQGWREIGRKIGFTNRTIWDEYGVHQPIWGPVWAETFTAVEGPAEASIAHLVEPRIEPEIVLGFRAKVEPDMNERAIMDAVDWVAHGFEIVQSLYPAWKFQAADCIAAFALHGHLFRGPPLPVEGRREVLFEALSTFSIRLFKDGEEMDRGVAKNVLDGPLSAIRHIAGVIAADTQTRSISAGETITTGTLTRAFSVAKGERWTTQFEGIALKGMDLRFI